MSRFLFAILSPPDALTLPRLLAPYKPELDAEEGAEEAEDVLLGILFESFDNGTLGLDKSLNQASRRASLYTTREGGLYVQGLWAECSQKLDVLSYIHAGRLPWQRRNLIRGLFV